MTRLLGLVAIAVALWMFLELGLARLKRALGEGRPRRRDRPEIAENLVRCSGCGVHVPRRQVAAGRCERCGPSRDSTRKPAEQPGVETPG